MHVGHKLDIEGPSLAGRPVVLVVCVDLLLGDRVPLKYLVYNNSEHTVV